MRHCRAPLTTIATLLTTVSLLVVIPWTPAIAEPTPSATGAAAKPGQRLCEIREPALREASGLAATAKGYAAVADGGESLRVYLLDSQCKVTSSLPTRRNPFDPEDLAVVADGTIWVGDIGDNDSERETVALFKLSPGKETADLYRMKYPDGAHDAEALLVPPQGSPIIVTKQVGGAALYTPAAPLDPNSPVELRKIGQITLTATGTSGGPLGSVGQSLITGGAVSLDGRKAVLRSYTDAYEWDVQGNDIGTAITKGKPRRTPLPDEPQGEAITYSRDGKSFVTVSEAREKKGRPQVVRYQPAVAAPTPASPTGGADAGPGLLDSVLDTLGLKGLLWVVVGIGILGLVLLTAGAFGIRASRRRRREEAALERDRSSPPRRDAHGDRRRGGDWHAGGSAGDDAETDVIPRVPTGYARDDHDDPGDGPYERMSRRRGARHDHGSYDEPYDQGGAYPDRRGRRGEPRRDRESDGPRW